MEKTKDAEIKTGRINADIITLIESVNSIGWKELRNLSIYRIIYLSSILYSFKYQDKKNPFMDEYDFVIDLRGPYSDKIEYSINDLLLKDFIDENPKDKKLKLSKDYPHNFNAIPGYTDKKNWIDIIVHLIGKYGEDKIYDFIFRDPEYRHNIDINSTKPIDLDNHNETIRTLNNFKAAFEKSLGKQAQQIDDKKYLELYFDYVFSQIIRGDK